MWNPILGRAGYGQHRNDFSPGGSKFPWCKRDDGLYDRFQNRFFCQHTDHRNGTGALHFYKPESGSRRNPKGKKREKTLSELGMDIQCGSAAGSMVSRKNDHSYFYG